MPTARASYRTNCPTVLVNIRKGTPGIDSFNARVGFESIHDGHRQVKNDQIQTDFFRSGDSFRAVRGLVDIETP